MPDEEDWRLLKGILGSIFLLLHLTQLSFLFKQQEIRSAFLIASGGIWAVLWLLRIDID
jgi:hypothetical protein